jgi:hypothetical protein
MKILYWYLYYRVWRTYQRLRKYIDSVCPRLLSAEEILSAKSKGCTLDAIDRESATQQTKCNHLKGGVVESLSVEAINHALSHGTDHRYAVIKHQHFNGDIWVSCTRCGRKWKPPIRSEYKNDREFYKAVEEYKVAVDFKTDNKMSTSLQFQFWLDGNCSAGHEYVRKQMANS